MKASKLEEQWGETLVNRGVFNTKCSRKGCKEECYKGNTFEYDGKDYCSHQCKSFVDQMLSLQKEVKNMLPLGRINTRGRIIENLVSKEDVLKLIKSKS